MDVTVNDVVTKITAGFLFYREKCEPMLLLQFIRIFKICGLEFCLMQIVRA